MLEVEHGNATTDTLADGGLAQEEQSPEVTANPRGRKSLRDIQWPTMYLSSEYVLITNEAEPESFKEVQSQKAKQCQIQVMEEEMDSLNKNDIYSMELSKGRKLLRNKQVFKSTIS